MKRIPWAPFWILQSGKKTTVNTEFKTKKPPLGDTDETPVHLPATKQATTKPRLTVVPTPRAAVQYLNTYLPPNIYSLDTFPLYWIFFTQFLIKVISKSSPLNIQVWISFCAIFWVWIQVLVWGTWWFYLTSSNIQSLLQIQITGPILT